MRINLPRKDESLQLGDIAQLTDSPRVRAALKRLAEDKAPATVAQLVMWRVAVGLDWATIAKLSRRWSNAQELALAKALVARLDAADGAAESAPIYWDVTAVDAKLEGLAEQVRKAVQ